MVMGMILYAYKFCLLSAIFSMQLLLPQAETMWCFAISCRFWAQFYTDARTDPDWDAALSCQNSRAITAGIAVSISYAVFALFAKSTASSQTVKWIQEEVK